MMICVVVAELIAIGVFNFWPSPSINSQTYQDMDTSDDVAAIQDVVITRQQDRPPPPPKPQSPIPEPTDEIIEEEIVEINEINVTDYSDSLAIAMEGSQGESEKPTSNPQTAPSVVRIVEPTVPDAAKKANIKAEIWVTFLVDTQGKVEEASISQIKLYDRETGEVQNVQTIKYGLPEATLNAALQWKFRPAKDNGELVRAYTKHIFTFGF
jgi:outer membrane biosynthesis protein TonB